MPTTRRRKAPATAENKLDENKAGARNLAAPDLDQAEARDLAATAPNQAESYGVRLIPAQVPAGQEYWQAVSVRHLSPDENRGKHAVFVDAQDASGQRRRDPALRIGWTWEGRNPNDRADPRPLDKPDNEPAGNVDMFSGQHVELWMEGDGLPSDRVAGMHTNHPDEPGPKGEMWNTIGHHSFHVVFRRIRTEAAPSKPEAPKPEVAQPPAPAPAPVTPPPAPPIPSGEFRFEVWPTEFRTVTQGFGANPQNYKKFGLPGHEGLDIRATTGSKVFCVAPGQVKLITRVGADPTKPAYGNHVRVLHAGGYETIYAHLETVSVEQGQTVAAGDVLGTADNTGNSAGAHLHLTLKHHGQSFGGYPGSIIDPTPFLAPLLKPGPAPAPSGVLVREKLGLNCNAPTDESGRITPRLTDPRLIADTGVGWVRLNFILRPFNSPNEAGWVQNYRTLIKGLRDQGLKIYGLVHAQAVAGDPGNQFRNEPPAGAIDNEWIRRYAENFRIIVQQFRDQVDVFESFNEPNDWHRVPGDPLWEQAWIHPYWFAVMLQRVYEAVRDLNVKLVSGPLLSTQFGNSAAPYLAKTYEGGIKLFKWGTPGAPVPFDGIGFHPYVLMDSARPAVEIPQRYNEYMKGVQDVIKASEKGTLRPIYVSEIGFQNAEDRQVECMKVVLRSALDDPSTALCFWYGMQDDPGESYGLFRKEGLSPDHRKPVYKAFVDLAKENRRVPVATLKAAPLVANAKFVAELDGIKDGTAFAPGAAFTKIWRMRNTGTASWGPGYRFVRVDGLSLGAPAGIDVPACAPGQTVDLKVSFVVPEEPETCTSRWQLVDPAGKRFGDPVWTTIQVKAAAPAEPSAAGRGLFEEAAPALLTPEGLAPFASAAASPAASAALAIIYTTYWLRVQAALAAPDSQQALKDASDDALRQIKEWAG